MITALKIIAYFVLSTTAATVLVTLGVVLFDFLQQWFSYLGVSILGGPGAASLFTIVISILILAVIIGNVIGDGVDGE